MLSQSEDDIVDISKNIDKLISRTKRDRKNHFLISGVGLTLHCNDYPIDIAIDGLKKHCKLHKYEHKVDKWFGIIISPQKEIRFVLSLDHKWEISEEMDFLVINSQFSRNN